MPKHILLYIYNSFNDPIVQGSVLTYIIRYKSKLGGKSKFTLITFEQEEYKLSTNEIEEKKQQLSQFDIDWIPLKYHSGGILILLKKMHDLLNGLFSLIKLNKKINIDLIYTVGTIGGSMGYFLAKFMHSELVVHTFEPHSEFMIDFGIWRKNSLSFKLLNYMEWKLAKKATYLMTGTDSMIKRISEVRTKSGVFKVPSCVDLEKFKPNTKIREDLRERFGISNKFVLLYLGKFGGIYLTKEPFNYFKHFLNYFKENNPHILIISPTDNNWIKSELHKESINNNFTILNNIPFFEIQNYICIADIGYCGIPPLTSQKYRSPIKNGEYLACGLPYIVYKGVSEDDIIALENNVGVVLQSSDTDIITDSFVNIEKFILEKKESLTNRCRKVVEKHRGIQQTDEYFKLIFG